MTRRAGFSPGSKFDSRTALTGDDADPLVYVSTGRRGVVRMEHDRLVSGQAVTLEDVRRYDAEAES